MGTFRKLRRSVAKHRLKKMGVVHINKSRIFHDDWYDISAPDFAQRMKAKANKAKEEKAHG